MLKLHPHEIEEYLHSQGLKLRRRGQKAELFKCPFCNGGENNDRWTCVVYLDNDGGNFKCMRGSCDRSGSFWQFVEHFGGNPRDFYDFGNEREFKPSQAYAPALTPKITFHKEEVKANKLTDEALKYLRKRGFVDEVLDEVAIWCDEKGLINFGYYYKSECCMVKVRQPRKPAEKEQKAWQKWKGGLRTLWGLEQCDFAKPYLVITFGEYDRIALHQARIGNCVSVPCGDSDLEWINVCFEELQKCNEIYLWIDNDEAGLKALPKIAERLGKHKVKVVSTKFKDANEMLLLRTKEVGREQAENEMFEAVASAEWYFKGDIIEVADIEQKELDWDGYKSGIDFLDTSLGGFLKGCLTLHFGDTKAGKSTAVNQIIAQSLAQGAKVCVWTGEDTPEDFKYKLSVHLAQYEGTDTRQSKAGATYTILRPGYQEKVNEFMRNRLFLIDKRFGLTEDLLLKNFQLAFERFGCDVFVWDNVMKTVFAKDSSNINARQAVIANAGSDFVKDTKTHLHLIAHIKKTEKSDENKPPTSKNAPSGAKEMINICDSAVFWWRIPEAVKSEYNNADTLCGIVANRRLGIEGTKPLIFDKQTKSFGEDAYKLRMLTYL